MKVTIGTFNLNNLFSRFNFEAEIDEISSATTGQVIYQFSNDDLIRIRKYKGKLIKQKDPEDTQTIAARIKTMNVDVLAVQEVEDIDTLRRFNTEHLGSMYSSQLLIEGNDPRFIDVGILSKLPIGGACSWQYAVHHSAPSNKVFSRDLIEIEILNAARTKKLVTIFNTHLKSKFCEPGQNEADCQIENDKRRTLQSEVMARIIKERTRPNSLYVLTGDMNDTPDAVTLAPFAQHPDLQLVNGLTSPQETRPAKPDNPPPPQSKAWTHRFKKSGQPAQYELFDQIWLSPALAARQTGAFIDRRTKHSGDGSDHDPAWVEVNLP